MYPLPTCIIFKNSSQLSVFTPPMYTASCTTLKCRIRAASAGIGLNPPVGAVEEVPASSPGVPAPPAAAVVCSSTSLGAVPPFGAPGGVEDADEAS